MLTLVAAREPLLQINALDRQIVSAISEHPDSEIFLSPFTYVCESPTRPCIAPVAIIDAGPGRSPTVAG